MRELVAKVFVNGTNNALLQLIRYFFVGGAAFVVDYGFLYILTEYAGIHYMISATLSFTVGLIVNYLISIVWVFNSRRIENRMTEFTIFALIGVVGLGLNALIMWGATDIIGLYYMLSKIISTGVVFFWNFGARRFILFRK